MRVSGGGHRKRMRAHIMLHFMARIDKIKLKNLPSLLLNKRSQYKRRTVATPLVLD